MLSRAISNAETTKATSASAKVKPEPPRHSLSSSSISPSARHGDISQSLQRGCPPGRVSITSKPAFVRSDNRLINDNGTRQSTQANGPTSHTGKPKWQQLNQTGTPGNTLTQPTSKLSSLYKNKDDSFKNKPSAAEATDFAGRHSCDVHIGDGDLSDDSNLENALRNPNASPATMPISSSFNNKIPTTSQVTWPSSPDEHKYLPTRTQSDSRKRPSPQEGESALDLRPKQKRKLPWDKLGTNESGYNNPPDPLRMQSSKALSTYAPTKKEKLGVLDQSVSETQERRKNLKLQSKKTETNDDLTGDGPSTSADAQPGVIHLSVEQRLVRDLVINQKKSVFFTGPAGTGKSILMRAIIAELKKKWARDPERVSVTASTGLAACNIGGMTLHSFAGIGLGKEDVPTLVKKIRRNPKAKNRWLKTSSLVIDEISMVDGELFDKLASIARALRNNGRPWGGIQLIITGDFFQLPPVMDKGNSANIRFAFDASTWDTSIDHTIGLTHVFRQRDPVFANMLNEMRLGKISDETVRIFNALKRDPQFKDEYEVTELFPTRHEVDRANGSKLQALPGEAHEFQSDDSGDTVLRGKLLENMMAPKALTLKKGAQVMLIKNLDDSLVNGSLGKIRGFMSEATFELWSGDQTSSGEPNDDTSSVQSKEKIKTFQRNDGATKGLKEYPVVQFTGLEGTHRTLLMLPEEWKVELPNGEVQAARKQLPLILAWALSIHKAQGQTLQRVKVDLGKIFEKGQAYVALSRAVSKDGLQVLRFDSTKVKAHPRVINFYDKLYSAEKASNIKRPGQATISVFAQQALPSTQESLASKAAPSSRAPPLSKTIDVFDSDEEEAAKGLMLYG